MALRSRSSLLARLFSIYRFGNVFSGDKINTKTAETTQQRNKGKRNQKIKTFNLFDHFFLLFSWFPSFLLCSDPSFPSFSLTFFPNNKQIPKFTDNSSTNRRFNNNYNNITTKATFKINNRSTDFLPDPHSSKETTKESHFRW